MNASPTAQLFFRSCLETSPTSSQPRPFSLSHRVPVPNRAQTQLHQLKRQLLRAVLEQAPAGPLYKRLCGAANQAAELAWSTAQPVLVFPCLFEELVQNTCQEL